MSESSTTGDAGGRFGHGNEETNRLKIGVTFNVRPAERASARRNRTRRSWSSALGGHLRSPATTRTRNSTRPRRSRPGRRAGERSGTRSSCSATASRCCGDCSLAAARPGLEHRRGTRRRPLARGPRAGRAGDARHSLHRLRSAHAGRHARQGLRQAAGRLSRTSPRRAWVLVDAGDWPASRQRTGRAAISGVRQAGLRGFEQGHPRPAASSHDARRNCGQALDELRRRLPPAGAGRGVHRRRRADGRRGRQSAAGSARHHAGACPRSRRPRPFVYSLEVKRDWQRQVRYECPAQLSADDPTRSATRHWPVGRRWAAATWRAIDFRLRDGVPYFLEANPLPGLSPISGDLVMLSACVGIEYPELIAPNPAGGRSSDLTPRSASRSLAG